MRRSAILRAIVATWSGPSSWVTPTRATRPGRVSSPTTSPSTVTAARVTRCSTALTRSLRDADGDDGADLLAVAEDRGVLEAGVRRRLHAQPAEHGRQHDRARALATVGDLQGDAAPVGQADGVHRLGAVLADQALGAADQGGDVTPGAADVLGEGAHRGGDVVLGGPRRGGGDPAEGPGQP